MWRDGRGMKGSHGKEDAGSFAREVVSGPGRPFRSEPLYRDRSILHVGSINPRFKLGVGGSSEKGGRRGIKSSFVVGGVSGREWAGSWCSHALMGILLVLGSRFFACSTVVDTVSLRRHAFILQV